MSISPLKYTEKAVFDRELCAIFAHSFYITSLGRVAGEQAFYSFFVGERPMVLRSTPAGFRLFENICLHRANLIDPAGYGNRPFRCSYHGWAYAPDGSLQNAPLCRDLLITANRLETYPLATINDLLIGATAALRFDSASAGQALRSIGYTSGDVFHQDTLWHNANWKLLVENVLEPYHLSFVHHNSFVPAGMTSTNPYTWATAGDMSWNTLEPRDSGSHSLQKLVPDSMAGYSHAFIFPNLFVSVTSGLVGFRSHFLPVSHDKTLLAWELFETPLLALQRTAIRDYIRKEAIRFTSVALEEDKTVIEQNMLGIRHAKRSHQLQTHDSRISHFHDVYLRYMNEL